MGRLTTVSLLFLILLQPARVFAAETLHFHSPENMKVPTDFASFFNGVFKAGNLQMAVTDLNGDGLHEYFARPADCSQAINCAYAIAARRKDEVILLGNFEARSVLVSDRKTYGVRNLIVYNDPGNDFDSVYYIWNPQHYRFEAQITQ